MNRRQSRTPAPLVPARRHSGAVAALGVAAALTLTGCQFTSTIQTDRPYEPADGVSSQVGDLQVRNLLIVAGEKGGAGNLVGLTANPTDQAGQITFTTQNGKPITLEVPAHGTVQLSTPDKLVSAGTVTQIPGDITTVRVSSPTGGGQELQVPILYPQGPYTPYAPTGWTPTPKPAPAPAPAH